MTPLVPPASLNYIGAFLTFDCNLHCSYCINDPEQRGDRKTIFITPINQRESYRTELMPVEWAEILNRIPAREDLPITFQGGEPTLYWKGNGLGGILQNTENYADLLTNFALDPETFARKLNGEQRKLQRRAPYPPIRVSFHIKEMDRLWGNGFTELVSRCEKLSDYGFTVSPDPAESHIGIYVVDHPENHVTSEMQDYCRDKLPFFMKDFLGVHDGELHGQYGYPHSTDLVSSGAHDTTLKCQCRTTELLIDPLGFVWGCHFYLYTAWEKKTVAARFHQLEEADLDFAKVDFGNDIRPIGHMLDPAFTLKELEVFRDCSYYGRCVGCDTKLKRDRFATENVYRSSVIIRNIQWPQSLKSAVSNDYKRKL